MCHDTTGINIIFYQESVCERNYCWDKEWGYNQRFVIYQPCRYRW